MMKQLSNILKIFALTILFVSFAQANNHPPVNLYGFKFSTQYKHGDLSAADLVINIPFPLTVSAHRTGNGLFGGILYLDGKSAYTDTKIDVASIGFARIYYLSPVDSQFANVLPYATLARYHFIDLHTDSAQNFESRRHYLLPGTRASLTRNKHRFYFDTELTHWNKPLNNFLFNSGWTVALSQQLLMGLNLNVRHWNLKNKNNNEIQSVGSAYQAAIKTSYLPLRNGNQNTSFFILLGSETSSNQTTSMLSNGKQSNQQQLIIRAGFAVGNIYW
ncbi:MAG: hypothetical protein OEY38_21335 [Gammaproteobacteria bacterium]|nr:hypothetical protein [Gammaproteobacteria bacterium]